MHNKHSFSPSDTLINISARPGPLFRRSLLAAAIMACTSPLLAQELKGSEASDQGGAPEIISKSDGTAIASDSIEEVTVTAQRRSLETALELKRASDTVSDSIVLDEAGKVPSTSLLEILQRVPGITINRVRSAGSPDQFTFEGSGLQIRGLSGTKGLINGREVFQGGLGWSDIGPELLKGVTTYKASRADLIEGGVAGTIDLQTYMPFDFDGTQVSAAVSGSYGDFSEKTSPSASILASTRFDTDIGEFGVLVDGAYSRIESQNSFARFQPYFQTEYQGETAFAPGGFFAGSDQFERTREGFYGAVQWRPTEELEFFHTTFISGRESIRDTQYISPVSTTIGLAEGSVVDDDGVFERGSIINSADPNGGIPVGSTSNHTPSENQARDFSQGFTYASGPWEVRGTYQHVETESHTSKYGISLNGAGVVQQYINASGSSPKIGFDGSFQADPATTGLSNFAWLNQDNEARTDAVTLDVSYDIDNGFFKKAAVGARVARRKESDSFVGTWWSASGRGWNGVPQTFVATAQEGDFRLEEFSDFFKGDVNAPASAYVADPSVLKGSQLERVLNTYAACAPDLPVQCSDPTQSSYLYGNPIDPTFALQPSFSTTRPDTQSAYVMVGFENASANPFLNFSGNVGVRYVRNEVESVGNFVFNGGTTYYLSLEDAAASLEMIGGIDNLEAWRDANPEKELPLTLTSVSSSFDRAKSYTNDYFLPSFNIKFDPFENWIFRFALTKTLTPPNYSDIRAQGSAGVSTVENPLESSNDSSLPGIFSGYGYTSGNPELKPEVSLNKDFSVEWYPSRGTTMHMALFHKAIDNKVLYNDVDYSAGDILTVEKPLSIGADGGEEIFVDGPINGAARINSYKTSSVKGIELGGRTYFDSLPGRLSGLGIDANVTYIDSSAPDSLAFDMTGATMTGLPLPGMSKLNYNATMLYDWDKFSARLSWQWRSRYLITTNDSSTTNSYSVPGSAEAIQYSLPIYGAADGRLDGSIAYQFTENVSLKFNVANITDEITEAEMEILPGKFVTRSHFISDRRYSLDLGIRF